MSNSGGRPLGRDIRLVGDVHLVRDIHLVVDIHLVGVRRALDRRGRDWDDGVHTEPGRKTYRMTNVPGRRFDGLHFTSLLV